MNRLLSFVPALAVLALVAQPADAVLVFDNGSSNTVDQTVNDFIRVQNSNSGAPTLVTFNTGADVRGTDRFDDTVFVLGTSRVVINNGVFADDVSSYDGSSIEIRGGTLRDDVFAANSSTISFLGGTVDDDIEAVDNSTVFIRGGSVGQDVEAFGGTIDISGGQLAANGLDDLDSGFGLDFGGLITLRGTNFSVDGTPIDSGFVTEVFGELSGTLADGSVFTDIPFDRNFFFSGLPGQIRIVSIPEASTTVFGIALTGFFLARRRRGLPAARSCE